MPCKTRKPYIRREYVEARAREIMMTLARRQYPNASYTELVRAVNAAPIPCAVMDRARTILQWERDMHHVPIRWVD